MGLLLDEDAIPITYRLYEGNTHDSKTMMPLFAGNTKVVRSWKNHYGGGQGTQQRG